MDLKTKKILLITLAGILGVGTIFFALVARGTITIKSPTPNDQASNDAWLKSLKVIPGSPAAKILSGEISNSILTPSATTTTGIIAQEAFLNTMMHQAGSDYEIISDEDAESLTDSILKNLTDQNPIKYYTKDDIILVPTNATTYTAYRTEFFSALNELAHSGLEDELYITAQAIDTRDPGKLAPLSASVTAYQKLIKKLLAMKTPDIMGNLHLLSITGYSTVLSGVQDMQQTFTDPARGIIGVSKYHEGLTIIIRIKEALLNIR